MTSSVWLLQDDLVPTCRELGIAFLAYSPLGRGMLTGTLTPGGFSAGDFRESMAPRFSKEAMQKVPVCHHAHTDHAKYCSYVRGNSITNKT